MHNNKKVYVRTAEAVAVKTDRSFVLSPKHLSASVPYYYQAWPRKCRTDLSVIAEDDCMTN